MLELKGTLSHFANPVAHRDNQYSAAQQALISVSKAEQAIADIKKWPAYSETPLHSLTSMAKDSGLKSLWYKDESQRFGLKSFKALGGAYAVACQLQNVLEERTGQRPTAMDLLEGKLKDQLAEIVVSCATDGNHGRSVAWGAQMFGCGCVIYIHRDVSEGRKIGRAHV